jgi:hypothetical protein
MDTIVMTTYRQRGDGASPDGQGEQLDVAAFLQLATSRQELDRIDDALAGLVRLIDRQTGAETPFQSEPLQRCRLMKSHAVEPRRNGRPETRLM